MLEVLRFSFVVEEHFVLSHQGKTLQRGHADLHTCVRTLFHGLQSASANKMGIAHLTVTVRHYGRYFKKYSARKSKVMTLLSASF